MDSDLLNCYYSWNTSIFPITALFDIRPPPPPPPPFPALNKNHHPKGIEFTIHRQKPLSSRLPRSPRRMKRAPA